MSDSQFEFGDEDDEPEDDSYISTDDIFVERGADGEALPSTVDVPELGGEAKVKPMAYGEVKRFFRKEMEDGELPDEAVAKILREYVVKPDLSDMSDEELARQMKPMVPQALMLAVFRVSGVEGDLSVDDEGDPELELDLGNS